MSRVFPIMIVERPTDDRSSARQVRAAGGCVLVVGLPWDMIAPHEKQALRNHSQTLKRLAERGGLSAGEALAVLEGYSWDRAGVDEGANHNRLAALLAAWTAKQTT